MAAYRVLNVLQRYANNDFNDFGECLKYRGTDRVAMLQMKNGAYSLKEMEEMLEEQYSLFLLYENAFLEFPQKRDLYEKMVTNTKTFLKARVL